jgi:hypothetical protein
LVLLEASLKLGLDGKTKNHEANEDDENHSWGICVEKYNVHANECELTRCRFERWKSSTGL